MDYRLLIGGMHKLELLRRIYIRGQSKGVEMHRGQVPILGYIQDNEGCTQTDAADHLGVSPASVALSSKRMCAAGLIERRSDELDMRCNRLSITPKGRRALEDFLSVFREIDAKTFEGFSEEELESFYSMLQRMMNNVAEGGADRCMGEIMRQLEEMGGDREC